MLTTFYPRSVEWGCLRSYKTIGSHAFTMWQRLLTFGASSSLKFAAFANG